MESVGYRTLSQRIDTMPVRAWHWKLVFLCMAGVMVENFDAMSLSMAMPVITGSWKLQPSMIGVLLSATSLGLLIGSALFGILCDVIGRRKTFLITTSVFTVFVLISVFAQNFTQLYILRVLGGLGLGGFIPVGMAYVSEFVPARVRGRFIGIYSIGNGIGYVLAVLTSMFVVQSIQDGWRIVFAVGGAAGLIVIPIMIFALPESVSWLTAKGRHADAVKMVEKIEQKAMGEITVPHAEAEKLAKEAVASSFGKRGMGELFNKQMVAATVLAMILWFVSSYTFFGFIQWMPTFLTKNLGYSLTKGYWFTLISALVGTGTPGLTVGFTSDAIGKRKTFIVCMLAYAAASLCFLWFGGWWLLPLYWFSSAMSSQLYVYTPALFQPAFKGSGLGLSSAVGRVAQFVAPMAIGLVVASSGLPGVLYVNVGLLLIAVAAAMFLGKKDDVKTSKPVKASA